MRRKKARILWVVFVAAIVVAGLLIYWIQRNAPPEAARLLPEADAYLYVNLQPMRAAGLFEKLPEVQLDPDYQAFVDRTGIRFERDLDRAALAIHLPPENSAVDQKTSDQETRYSEVFVGRFDPQKLRSYLEREAHAKETYRGFDVLGFPLPGRTVRAAMLGPERIAASNTASPAELHSMLDKAANFATTLRGPQLLREHYHRVPFGSVVWLIAKTGAQDGTAKVTAPGGVLLDVPNETVVVASLRYSGTIDLRLEGVSNTEAAAQKLFNEWNGYLVLLRTIPLEGEQAEPIKKVFESFKLEQDGDSTVLSGSFDSGLFGQMFSVQ